MLHPRALAIELLARPIKQGRLCSPFPAPLLRAWPAVRGCPCVTRFNFGKEKPRPALLRIRDDACIGCSTKTIAFGASACWPQNRYKNLKSSLSFAMSCRNIRLEHSNDKRCFLIRQLFFGINGQPVRCFTLRGSNLILSSPRTRTVNGQRNAGDSAQAGHGG